MPFKLITPLEVRFDGEAELVIAVGTEGEVGILPRHAPFLTALRPGLVRANIVRDGKTERLELATGEGFLQALPDRVTILVDAAYASGEVDISETRRERSDALERQRSAGSDLEAYRREQSIVDLAEAKLAVAHAGHSGA